MATAPFGADQAIGDIVAAFPPAADLFERLGIDFCCGGDRPLAEEIREHGLVEQEVIDALTVALLQAASGGQTFRDWRQARIGELARHITETHHAYLRRELPLLHEYVHRILKVHGSYHGDVLIPLAECFNRFQAEIMEHLDKEDGVLFPLILRYEETGSEPDRQQARQMLEQLEAEHDGAGQLMKDMRAVTNGYAIPEEACATYRHTFRKLEELERDMFRHVHLENHILFPQL